jgi:hypothetical protein
MNDDTQHHEEMRTLLVPFSLRLLDADERAAVERALESDASLRRELSEIEEGGAALLGTLPRVSAPPTIKSSVMSSVRASAEQAMAADPVSIADAPSARTGRRRRSWFTSPAFSGALAVACVALAVVAIDLNRDLNAANERADDFSIASAPELAYATKHTVATTDQFKDASGSLIRITDDKWLLAFKDVPEPAKGRSWQVWTATSAGEFSNVAQWSSGDTHLLVVDSDDIVEVMVSYERTTEPAPAPSSDPVADIKV